jgi:hypothetical protein
MTLFSDTFKQDLLNNYIYFLSMSDEPFYQTDNFGNPKFDGLTAV